MISEPYPRLLVSRDQVNQGAAALLMSVEAARRLGVPEENWVYLHGHADLEEQSLLVRPDLGHAPSAVMAVREALAMAGIGIDDVATFDLYSCFPVPVFNICDGMGIAPDDPRGLTADRWAAVLRRRRQQLLDARRRRNRGPNAKCARAIRSRRGQWRHPEQVLGRRLLHHPDGMEAGPQRAVAGAGRRLAHGIGDRKCRRHGTVETYTVRRDDGRPTGIIIGRLADDSRFLSTTEDDELIALLTDGDPLGRQRPGALLRLRQPLLLR